MDCKPDMGWAQTHSNHQLCTSFVKFISQKQEQKSGSQIKDSTIEEEAAAFALPSNLDDWSSCGLIDMQGVCISNIMVWYLYINDAFPNN